MVKKRIEITLTDKEWRLVQWEAEQDGISPTEELKALLGMMLDNQMDIYGAEVEEA